MSAPKCPRCSKSVYAAEQVLAIGQTWHKPCLRCDTCNATLNSKNINDNNGKVYCTACYGKNFGPKGFGFAGGGAFMNVEGAGAASATVERSSAPSTQSLKAQFESNAASDNPSSTSTNDLKSRFEKMSTRSDTSSPPARPGSARPSSAGPARPASARFGGAPKCPRCNKSVYHAEKVVGPGGDWHKMCFTCTDCNKTLSAVTLAEHGNQVYCKACHSKSFGPKGFGFGNGGAIMHTS
ncbi:hypothetical protein CYMTET_39027 [Cymbomonas tetramitiformis]|uniref:Cysteine-rich protein 1 n=1 Tax=Cymbomonas tetramitiformis TaxID=36881 RepID=A0AAE0CC97_9CHLO|nr:hypothetical protein CYMTET_39027 [Cymbomonas tetramitiformis]